MFKYFIKRFLTIIKYGRKCKVDEKAIILGSCLFEGNNKICRGAYVNNVLVGYASSIGSESYICKAQIGRFSSIGDNVKFISATHPLEPFVSTHPAFYRKGSAEKYIDKDKYSEYLTIDGSYSFDIGSDVWIGSNSIIRGGIRIGNGAIVAMGSVVTKDVEPYSIVGGVPAHFIRYRFTEEQRNKLLCFKWWDKPNSWIEEHAEYFSDIEKLLKVITQI